MHASCHRGQNAPLTVDTRHTATSIFTHKDIPSQHPDVHLIQVRQSWGQRHDRRSPPGVGAAMPRGRALARGGTLILSKLPCNVRHVIVNKQSLCGQTLWFDGSGSVYLPHQIRHTNISPYKKLVRAPRQKYLVKCRPFFLRACVSSCICVCAYVVTARRHSQRNRRRGSAPEGSAPKGRS